MSDGYKIYETATLAFQKLSPVDGDVIVIKFPADVEPMQMNLFCENLADEMENGITILGTRSGMEVEQVPESQMNKMGWYRFDTDKMN